jgi:hypothetical protein
MTENQILEILKLRYVVYKLGSEKGFWQDIEQKGAKEMMNYLFARTGNLAFYHLMLGTCRSRHKGHQEYYNLFKLPARIEEEILNYLKQHINIDISKLAGSPMDYLNKKASIVVSASETPTNIGNISENDFDTNVEIIASIYKNAFAQGTNNYPYFN